jgi:hypothetical protein
MFLAWIWSYTQQLSTVSVWALMTNEDLEIKTMDIPHYGLGAEMTGIVDSITAKIKTNDTYRSCRRSDIPDRFKTKDVKFAQNLKPGDVIQDKAIKDKIGEHLIFLTKIKVRNNNGDLKIATEPGYFYDWVDLPLIVDRQITMRFGEKTSDKSRKIQGLLYKFSNGAIGFYENVTGNYYELQSDNINQVIGVDFKVNSKMDAEHEKEIRSFK